MEVGNKVCMNGEEFICIKKFHDSKSCEDVCLLEKINKPKIKRLKFPKKSKYTYNWRTIRNSIIARDKFCQKCKSCKYLDVHHKDKNRENNNEDNLITLCAFCHSEEPGHESYKRVLNKRLSWTTSHKSWSGLLI